MADFISNLLFVFERLNWLSVLDILLVAGIFFGLLYSLRDTQAMSLLRGMIFLFVLLALLTSLVALPAFSWLISNALPALLLCHSRHLCTGNPPRAGTDRTRRKHS